MVSPQQKLQEQKEIAAIKKKLCDAGYQVIVSFSLNTKAGDVFRLNAHSVVGWPEITASEIGELKSFRELLYQARKTWAEKNGKKISEKLLRKKVEYDN